MYLCLQISLSLSLSLYIYIYIYVSEFVGVRPKGSPDGNSSSEFDVFALSLYTYASRAVSCVTCHA